MGLGEGVGAQLRVGQAKNVCQLRGLCWVTGKTADPDVVKGVANLRTERKTLRLGRGHRQITWDSEQREDPWKDFHDLINAFMLTGKDAWRSSCRGANWSEHRPIQSLQRDSEVDTRGPHSAGLLSFKWINCVACKLYPNKAVIFFNAMLHTKSFLNFGKT